MNLPGDQFRSLFKLFRPVMTSIDKVPNNFGFVDASIPAFDELKTSWKNLCDNFQPINLIPQWLRFKQISKSISSVFQSSIGNPDIQVLCQKAQKFDVTHDPDYLIQLKLIFLFIEKQMKRYTLTSEFFIFPFCELQDIFTILSKFNEVCLLIPEVTDRINSMNIGEPIETPDLFIINDTKPFEGEFEIDHTIIQDFDDLNQSEVDEEVHPILGKPISFEDQVQLAQMIDTISDANSVDKEKVAQIPFIEHQVRSLEPFIDRSKASNESLREINEYLSEPIKSIKAKMTDEGKSQTRIDEMIELNKLKAQEKVEEDQSESSQIYFDRLNQSCSEAGITLEKQVSNRRMKKFERDYMRESLQIDQIELSLNRISLDEKMKSESRDKLKLLKMPFVVDLYQNSIENDSHDHSINKLNRKENNDNSIELIDPVFIGCEDITNLNKEMKKKTDLIRNAVVDVDDDENKSLSKQDLLKLRNDLKKKNEKMEESIFLMKTYF